MQQQMEQVREEMKSKEVTGKSGNGLVTIILDGERNIKDLKIKPECVDPEDTEGLEDLIRAAYEEATSQLGDESDLGGMLPF